MLREQSLSAIALSKALSRANSADTNLSYGPNRTCTFKGRRLLTGMLQPFATGCIDPERTLVSVSSGSKVLLAPLLQRNIHICLPLILRCLGIDAQVIEEQRLVTQFLSIGRKPIAVNRIDRFADVIR